jgi:hypothetical protein
MGEVSIIDLDLAKNVFEVHGAAVDGSVVFRRKLTRAQVLKFFASRYAARWPSRPARARITGRAQLGLWSMRSN